MSSHEGVMAEGFVDISVPIRAGMPVWPGSVGIQISPVLEMARGDIANVTQISCDVHTGTHVDAPSHFIPGADQVENLPLETLIGEALVVELFKSETITDLDLEQLSIPKNVTRLLLRTSNSALWASDTFEAGYVGISVSAARWLVDRRIRLIGIDYLSIEPYGAAPAAHEVLLSNSVVILEGLNLSGVVEGMYELICLPLRLCGCEGAPARAALRSVGRGGRC